MAVIAGGVVACQNQSTKKDPTALLTEIKDIDPRDISAELKAEVEAAAKGIADPKTADDFFLKAYAAQMNGNYGKAIEYYQKVIELRPDDATTYNNMGISYDYNQDYDDAIESFEKAVALKPDYSEAYLNMAGVYDYEEDDDRVVECLKKAAQLGNNTARQMLKEYTATDN